AGPPAPPRPGARPPGGGASGAPGGGGPPAPPPPTAAGNGSISGRCREPERLEIWRWHEYFYRRRLPADGSSGGRSSDMPGILVGVDGSAASQEALEWAV